MAITNDFFTALNDPKAAMWSAGVAFNRSNPLPLDKWSVFQTMGEAVTYAESNAVAYPGQLIAVYDADAAVMTAYILQEEGGKLAPVAVGTTPVGDESTIVVAEDGTVSLAGIAGLVFTEENEDGEDVSVTYQPLLTSAGLTWVRPSATTVEGLATEIEGLKTRLTGAEGAIDALEGVVGKAAEGDAEATGLVKAAADNAAAIAAEVTAREEADKSNADAIAAVEELIGEVETDKTVVEMIADAVYDDTQIAADVQANADAIAEIEADYLKAADKIELSDAIGAEKTRAEAAEKVNSDAIAVLNGNTAVDGSVDKKIADAINVFATQMSDDDTVNTYKELINYAATHGTEFTELVGEVDLNTAAIATLNGDAETAGSVDKKIADAIVDANLGQYATGEALSGVDERLAAVEEDYLKGADKTELQGAIDAKAAAADLGALQTTVGEMDTAYKAADTALDGRISVLEAVGAEKNAIATVDQTQFGLDEARNLTLLDIAMGKVTGLEDALAGKVDVEEGKGLSANDFSDSLLHKLNGIEEGAQVNKIETVDTAQFAIDEAKNLTLLDIAMGKVTGLQGALDAKADRGTTLAAYGITDAYTKTETEGRIQEVLDGLSDTSETAASVAQALETYKTSNDARVGTIEGQIAAMEAGAQVNKIEAVKVGETLLDIVDKTVVIPVGAGLKASDEVTIAADGALGIGTIGLSKIVQEVDLELVLDGGMATK